MALRKQISDFPYALIWRRVGIRGEEIVFWKILLGFTSCNHRFDICLYDD